MITCDNHELSRDLVSYEDLKQIKENWDNTSFNLGLLDHEATRAQVQRTYNKLIKNWDYLSRRLVSFILKF